MGVRSRAPEVSMKPKYLILVAGITAALSCGAFAQQDEKLGKLSFPTSCDPKVQAEFERGVAMIHSYGSSTRAGRSRESCNRTRVVRLRIGELRSTFSATRSPPRRHGPRPKPVGQRLKRRTRSAPKPSASATGSRR